ELAYEERERLAILGADTADIDKRIIDLKREAREGRRPRGGDFVEHGRYRLIAQLGHGGFATVWKAYDRVDRSLVAVKALHGQYASDESRRERFFRGARKMNELRHSSIVRVIQPHGEHSGWFYFVMELAPDGDLHSSVLVGRAPPAVSLRAISTAADGLHYANENGMVHRDVTPSNILLRGKGLG